MVPMNFGTRRRKMTTGNEYPHDKDYQLLYNRVSRMKIDTMMEEPCPLYEPGWEDVTNSPEDWNDFWYNEDTGDSDEGRSSGDD